MKSKHVTREASSIKRGASNSLAKHNSASDAASRSDDLQYLNNRRRLFAKLGSIIACNRGLEIAARVKAGQYVVVKPHVILNFPSKPCKECGKAMQPVFATLKRFEPVCGDLNELNVYVCPHCGVYCLHI